jgi:hypothetical protein
MEHRGVRYEIKIAPGRRQWTWVVHTSPKPKQGSVEGPRRVAVLAAEKMTTGGGIDRDLCPNKALFFHHLRQLLANAAIAVSCVGS